MNEKPLERLNYYNGQRLQAPDFRLEQEYHMRVRRWLNRSLYSAGIAEGLNVTAIPKAPKVRVSPGLAIDSMGREIILLEEHEEVVPGSNDENNKSIGLYLTIRYAEETVAQQNGWCVFGVGSSEKSTWGGPSRVIAEPVLEWSDKLPHEASGKVLLAYVELGKGCQEVNPPDLRVRNNIGEASKAKVRQYALEGSRDIDSKNSGLIRFHVRGRQPSSVTLYLRGAEFPKYFYTELGRHVHTLSLSGNISSDTGSHSHGLSARYYYQFENFPFYNFQEALFLTPYYSATNYAWPLPNSMVSEISTSDYGDILGKIGGRIAGGSHSHPVTVNGSMDRIPPVGEDADVGANLTYLNDLEIILNGTSITEAVLRQIQNERPTENWLQLGSGSDQHPIVQSGTGGVKLDYIASFSEGEHEIELSVSGPRNGGRIYYNLYVE